MLLRPLILLTILQITFSIRAQEMESPVSNPYEASYALLIGNSAYERDWPSLPGVREDLQAVENVLTTHGFEVRMGLDYNKVQMDSAYSAFIATYGNRADNRLLFYYAGHGETVRTSYGESLSYLVPVDAPDAVKDVNAFQGMSMEMTQVEIYAKRIQSKHALFLFDACFAGSIFGQSRAYNEALAYQISNPVRQFITSGEADESVPDVSIFRQELVRALSGDAADENEDGFLTGSELGTFLQDQVVDRSNGRQHPQYGKIKNPSLDKGEFFFTLNPDSPLLASQSAITPKVGMAADLKRFGLLEVTSELTGTLIINGRVSLAIQQGEPMTFEDLLSGHYDLKFVGEENWQGSISIEAGQTTPLHIVRYTNKSRRNLFMPMTYVEAGKFEMGDPKGGPDHNVVHSVVLPSYEIGTYEVTVGQFAQFVAQTGYRTELEQMSGTHLVLDKQQGLQKKAGLSWRYGPDGQMVADMSNPVVFISWNDAMAFTRWMTETYEGTYRLPTEAEWEFAAQGGIRNRPQQTDSTVASVHSKYERMKSIGSPDSYPNELGVYHMNGSLSEWCLDWYDKNYYRRASKHAPTGPSAGEMKVVRGNAWINNELENKLTFRKKAYPNLCSFSDGFRVVRVIE